MRKRNNLKRKATNALKQVAYLAIWKEEIPKGKKKVRADKRES